MSSDALLEPAVLEPAVLAARLLLVGVFLVSAAAKLADRTGTRAAAVALGVPRALARPVAVALPVGELAAAVLLAAAAPALRLGAGLAAVALLAFTAALLRVLVRGEEVACHCFGALSDQPVGRGAVARNLGLLAAAGLVLLAGGDGPALPALLGASPAQGWVVAAALLGLLALLAWSAARLRAARAQPAAAPLAHAAGEEPPAPDLVLPDLTGVPVRLADVTADGRPALLVLLGAHCTACDELLPDLQAWQGAPGAAHVVVVAWGGQEDVRDKASAAPRLRVLVDEAGALGPALDLGAVPAAVLLTPHGTVAGAPAYGVDAVRARWADLPAPVPGVVGAPERASTAGCGWVVPPDVVHVVDGDATLVTRAGSGVRQALPATAGAIWRLVVAGHDLPGVVTALREDFPDAPDDLAEQVGALLDSLVAADLLRPAGAQR